ncbi:ABC transporter permease [Kineosporia sp. A_224]|uniref:ABC transporter permease n=1 Tax=Kineosporia sp. A_224 TaxID=1962180 RepID=UPI000B4AA92C|nr:ABC transporter permease [Kineosporia sp. A_224]
MARTVHHRLFWPVLSLLALVVLNAAVRPSFIRVAVRDGHLYGALVDILRQSAPLMMVALGMTLVIATRGIDLSVGAVMAVSGAVALTLIDRSADPGDVGTVIVAIAAGVGIGVVLGMWNGFLVTVLRVQPIVATLVLMLAGRGVALLVTGGFITTVVSPPLKFVASGYLLGLPFALFLSASAIAVVALVERRTALGLLTEAVGINPEASRLAGVRSRGIVFTAYVASGALAGLAGILYSSNIMAADANAAGEFIELYAILAVVLGRTSLLGGKFSIAGTVVGVLVIQTLQSTVLFLGVSSAQSPVFFAVVVAVVVLVQSPQLHSRVRRLSGRRRRAVPAPEKPARDVEVSA